MGFWKTPLAWTMEHQPQPHQSQNRPERGLSDPLYYDHFVPEPSSKDYGILSKEVAAMCGYEVINPNFTRVFNLLNDRLNLRLDKVEIEAFGLLYTRLAEAPRFGGDIHMPSEKAENPAVHSCHSLVLAQEVFRRAGLLAEGAQTPEVAQVRAHVMNGLLVHDLGEILGELTSLAQRSNNTDLTERPDIEREIARIHLIEAFRSALGLGDSPVAFEQFQYEHKRAAGIGIGGSVSHQDQDILDIIATYNSSVSDSPVSFEIRRRVNKFLNFYDMAELKPSASSTYERFVGNVVKIIEHVQGTRHLLRFATRHPDDIRLNVLFPEPLPNREPGPWIATSDEQAVPMRWLLNYRMIKGLQYMETEIAPMFEAAKGDDLQMRLARTLRDVAYITIAEWLSIAREVVDLQNRTNDPIFSQMMEIRRTAESPKTAVAMIHAYLKGKVEEDRMACRAQEEARHKKPHSECGIVSPDDRLLPIETRQALAKLYRQAVQRDFIPVSTTPLALLETLPKELVGFAEGCEVMAADDVGKFCDDPIL